MQVKLVSFSCSLAESRKESSISISRGGGGRYSKSSVPYSVVSALATSYKSEGTVLASTHPFGSVVVSSPVGNTGLS